MKKIWSVELETTLWNDESFNGTFSECVEYCEKQGYKIDGEEARLAELLIDEEGISLETLQIVEEI